MADKHRVFHPQIYVCVWLRWEAVCLCRSCVSVRGNTHRRTIDEQRKKKKKTTSTNNNNNNKIIIITLYCNNNLSVLVVVTIIGEVLVLVVEVKVHRIVISVFINIYSSSNIQPLLWCVHVIGLSSMA